MAIGTALVRLAFLFCALLTASAASAQDAAPARASVAFTPAFAASLRDARRFEDVTSAAGVPGALVGKSEESDGPHVVYAWTGAGGRGSMRAYLYRSGDFSVVMRPEGGDDIVMNSFGAFVCPSCSPPVNACGRRPWWVPHDVHWDNFDCGCTLAGPQSVRVGRC